MLTFKCTRCRKELPLTENFFSKNFQCKTGYKLGVKTVLTNTVERTNINQVLNEILNLELSLA